MSIHNDQSIRVHPPLSPKQLHAGLTTFELLAEQPHLRDDEAMLSWH